MKFKITLLIALHFFATLIHPMENHYKAFIEIQCQDAAIKTPLWILEKSKTIKHSLENNYSSIIDLSPLSITAQTMDQLVQIIQDNSLVHKVATKDLFPLIDAADALEIDPSLRSLLAQKITRLREFSKLPDDQRKRLLNLERSIDSLSNEKIEEIKKKSQWYLDLSDCKLLSLKGLERFAQPEGKPIWQKLLSILKNPINNEIRKINVANNNLSTCNINYIRKIFPNCAVFNLENNNIKAVSCDQSLLNCTINLSENNLHPDYIQQLQHRFQTLSKSQQFWRNIAQKYITFNRSNCSLVIPGILFIGWFISLIKDEYPEIISHPSPYHPVLEKFVIFPFAMACGAFGFSLVSMLPIGVAWVITDDIATNYLDGLFLRKLIINDQKEMKKITTDTPQINKLNLIAQQNKSSGLKDLLKKSNN